MSTLPVVAIRANDISFLGLSRALSKIDGVDFFGVVYTWHGAKKWYSDFSLFQDNRVVVSNPAENPKEALAQFLELGKSIYEKYEKKALVFCSSDVNQVFFHQYEKELLPYFFLIGDKTGQDYRADVSDKGHFFDQIKQSVPELVPSTISFYSKSCLRQLDSWDKYPCVLKPTVKDLSQSFYRMHDGDKAVLCKDKHEVKVKLTSLLDAGYSMLLQDFIPFKENTDEIPAYLYVDMAGEIRIFANCIKDIIYPPLFGTAISVELSYERDLVDVSKKVANSINWWGPLMIEFVKDNRDDSLKILEINTRPWLFHDFYRQVSLPFVSYVAIELAKGLEGEPKMIYPHDGIAGFRNIDLIAMASYFFSQKKEYDYNPQVKTKMFIDFCNSSNGNVFFAHFDQADPEPFFVLVQDLAQEYGLDENMLKSQV